jgi:anti-anti-sigma factor
MAPDLKSELVVIVENGEKNILIDLTDCNYCDSSGMSALLLGNRLCNETNGKFVLYGVSQQIGEMIDLAGFDSILIIAEDKSAAEEYL